MKIEELVPDRIFWSKGAEDFAYTAVDIVRELGRQDKEWDCDMITLRDDPKRVIRRLIPSVKSYVGSGYVQVPGRAISDNIDIRLRAMRQKEGLDFVMSGILHSHASFGSFFSGTDYNDFEKEGPKIAGNNLVFEGWLPYELFEKKPRTELVNRSRITLSDSQFDPKLIEHFPDPGIVAALLREQGILIEGCVDETTLCEKLLQKVKREYQEYVRVGIAQAIVVDATKNNPFGILGYYYTRPLSSRSGYWRTTQKVAVETVPVKKDMRFNRNRLKDILRRSLHIDERPPEAPSCTLEYPGEVVYPDEIVRDANRFVFSGASYIYGYNSPERKYSRYLATILNELPFQGIVGTVKRLGPLTPDQGSTLVRYVRYDQAVQASCRLLSSESLEKFFMTTFGSAESIADQNTALKFYVAHVLSNRKWNK